MKNTIDRYNLVSNYIHNQTEENWQTLCKSIIDNQGEITGEYPTNFVMFADIYDAVNDETLESISDEYMRAIAAAIGASDTEYGTFWTSLTEFYYDVINPR